MRFAEVAALPGVRETVELHGRVGILAPHGGAVEDGTELLAEQVADRTGSSLYHVTYPGSWEEARRLHVSCTRIAPDETEALAAFTAHCRVVFAIHGFTRSHLREAALVGGGNSVLAARLAGELRLRLPEPAVVLDGDDVPTALRGRSPANLANRFPEPGVQVELAPRLRVTYPNRLFWGGCTPNPNIYADAVCDALIAVVEAYTDESVILEGVRHEETVPS